MCRDADFLIRMFTTYARPLLEYATCVWSPFYIGDIDAIESVQRTFTRRIPSLAGMSYPERLVSLNLQSLELRRLIFDLVEIYKMLFCTSNIVFSDFFSLKNFNGRGHSYQIEKPMVKRDIKKSFFTVRPINAWNWLPTNIFLLSKGNFHMFKTNLNTLDFSRFLKGRWRL